MTSNIRERIQQMLPLGIVLLILPLVFPAQGLAEGEKPQRIQRENQAQARRSMGAPPKAKPAPRSNPSPRTAPRTSPSAPKSDRGGRTSHDYKNRDYRGDRNDNRRHYSGSGDRDRGRGYRDRGHRHYRGHRGYRGRGHGHYHGRSYCTAYHPYYYPYSSSYLGLYIRPYGYFGGHIGYRHGPSVTYHVGRTPYQEDMGGIDFDVRPEKAEIYIDGQLIGVADQFDGFPSYLWLEKGTYDVVIYRDGYETISRQMTIYPGVVIDVEDRMQRGQAVRPEDLVSKSTERRDERIRRDRERAAAVERAEADRAERRRDSTQDEKVGRLQLSIWPDDAAVYLDGHFLGTAGEVSQLSSGLVVEPGEHRIEVVHPAFQSQLRDVEVDRGEKLTVDLDLSAP